MTKGERPLHGAEKVSPETALGQLGSSRTRISVHADLTPFTANLQQITELNVKRKPIKLLDDDIGEHLGGPGRVAPLIYNSKGTIHARND